MKIIYPAGTIKVQMDEDPGFYFDIELVESEDGMIFAGWLYHEDFSIKTHIVSIPAETSENNEAIDWFPVVCMMNEYIEKNDLIAYYWEQIEILEY